jgi:hypothetical protein
MIIAADRAKYTDGDANMPSDEEPEQEEEEEDADALANNPMD